MLIEVGVHDRAVERARDRVDASLDHLRRDRRPAGVVLRPGDRPVHDQAPVHHLVEHAPLEEPRSGDPFSAHHELLGAGRADQAHEERQAAPHQVHPDVDLGIGHEAVARADAEVEGGGDARPAAHRRPPPRRDGDLVHLAKGGDRPLPHAPPPALHDEGRGRRLGLRQVRPRGEVPPGPGEDDRAGLVIVPEGERRVLDLFQVPRVEGVRLLRAVERHDGEAAPPLHLEMPVLQLNLLHA